MRFLLIVIAIALVSWGITWIMPWWAAVIAAALICAVTPIREGKAFWAGFAGVFLFWAVAALVTSSTNDHLLSGRMAKLFQLPHWSLFILVGAFIGGIVGGLGGWTGAALKRAFEGAHKSY